MGRRNTPILSYLGLGLFVSCVSSSGYEKAEKRRETSINERISVLIRQLNDYFQVKIHISCYYPVPVQSPFDAGDVDVFLQASPFTRGLTGTFKRYGLDSDVMEVIEGFLGGSGYVQGDLERLAEKVEPLLDTVRGRVYNNEVRDVVYATTQNALSFMRTTWKSKHDDQGEGPWPRNTQIIRLSHRADLLGALMDFDLSIVACAFDGNNVRVTPRAAFSLVTMVQVVTPFIMEEKRNWTRIVKVWYALWVEIQFFCYSCTSQLFLLLPVLQERL